MAEWKNRSALLAHLTRLNRRYESTLLQRFWARVDSSGGLDACWLWLGLVTTRGYGQLRVSGRQDYAHRVSYRLNGGEIPDGLVVCHRCDTPRCCNPQHLFLGTHADNHADRNAKGRQARGERSGRRLHPEAYPKGEAHPSAKLTSTAVREIRRRFAAGESTRGLGRAFGVRQQSVSAIVRGRTWRHVV